MKPSHRLCLSLALPLIFSAASAQAPAKVEQFTLSNGLTVIVKPDRRAPTAAHMLWVRVGSMDEVDGTTGVAHVLEHMLFKGTATVKPGEFSRRVATALPTTSGQTTSSSARLRWSRKTAVRAQKNPPEP